MLALFLRLSLIDILILTLATLTVNPKPKDSVNSENLLTWKLFIEISLVKNSATMGSFILNMQFAKASCGFFS